MNASAPHAAHPLRGIFLLVGAVSTFAVMDTTAKWLSQTYPVPMVVWARYFSQTVILLLVLGPRLGLGLVRSRRPGLQILRGIVLGSATLFFFNGIALMPIAEAAAITFVSPFILVIMSVWLLKERVAPATWLAIAVGFAGVLLIIRPGGAVFQPAALLPLATAVCFAGYQLLTRKLAGVDPTLTTLFISAAVGTALVSLVLPVFWTAPKSFFHGALFAMMGVLASVGHFMLIRAFEQAAASTLAPFVYSQLVAVLALGYGVFGTFPDQWSLVGMGIIVASGVAVAMTQRR